MDWSANSTESPIIPGGEMRQVEIDIIYRVTYGSIFPFLVNMLMNFYEGKQVEINLEIIDQPEWCHANLKSNTLTTQISREETIIQTFLTIQLDRDAPAYSAGYVTLRASVEKIGLIQGYEKEFKLTFTPEYLPAIVANPEYNLIFFTPNTVITSTINITNLGNAETVVFNEIESVPEDWFIRITPKIQLSVNQTKTVTIYAIIPPGTTNEIIHFILTPARAENINQKGEPSIVTIEFILHP